MFGKLVRPANPRCWVLMSGHPLTGRRVTFDMAQDHGRPVTRVLLGDWRCCPGAMAMRLRSVILRTERRKGQRGLYLRAKRRQHLTPA